ncbi:hypothetical protein BTA51_06975 [Hahella sp. CCB-MM4]|uniref:zinc-ribbon domain-containing protein n=1 Tax=Hahella sp. (strain CCB-MM4) TaxID=1926491 RepID=UPI000B9C49FA|nr:zinc-ribbon domain-containing protein [Hahella sp. CCB-MM4]OZG74712.1 hypothetical protein BTA51_06975 [Hahella sp. CCB-MM4]
MKSNKQRRLEIIKLRRLKRALREKSKSDLPTWALPLNAVGADRVALKHNNTYGPLPEYYVDKPFICVDCGMTEVWTAQQQKWWYEIAKGNINTTAIRCSACRRREKERKAEARRIHLEGLEKKLTQIKSSKGEQYAH